MMIWAPISRAKSTVRPSKQVTLIPGSSPSTVFSISTRSSGVKVQTLSTLTATPSVRRPKSLRAR